MSTERPLVSAIIPAYNSAAFLARAIRSALAQDYPNKQVIVVDDGSTDNTEEIAKSFGAEIIYVRQENAGPAAARNRGIKETRAEYIAFLDSDDEWLPGRLSKCIQPMIEDDSIGLTYCLSFVRRLDGREEIYGRIARETPLHRSMIFQPRTQSTPATTCRRSILEQVGGFDRDLKRCQDHDLWIRIRECSRTACVKEPLVRIYAREDSHSGPMNKEEVIKSYCRVVHNALERRPDLYGPDRDVLLANLHYLWGMYYYYREMHREARREFIQSFQEKRFFETFLRIMETIPPATFMRWLRNLKCRFHERT
jgi:glycosyltransferase involved in cell wall biosynthesis